MLTHPPHERLIALGLTGMAKAFEEQRQSPDLDALSFEERIGLLVDREAAERDTKRLTTRLKFAALRQSACVEDVDLRTPRGIDRAVFARLVASDWIDHHENLFITGATGLGKSWIACALGHKACRDNRSVLYHRVPRLFETLALARGDGVLAVCSKRSDTFNFLSSMTGACRFSIRPNGATSSRFSMIVMVAHRLSSQAKSLWTTGTRSSAIPPSVTQSWIASFTMLTVFNSAAPCPCHRKQPLLWSYSSLRTNSSSESILRIFCEKLATLSLRPRTVKRPSLCLIRVCQLTQCSPISISQGPSTDGMWLNVFERTARTCQCSTRQEK